jgi:hypothetical protein
LNFSCFIQRLIFLANDKVTANSLCLSHKLREWRN